MFYWILFGSVSVPAVYLDGGGYYLGQFRTSRTRTGTEGS